MKAKLVEVEKRKEAETPAKFSAFLVTIGPNRTTKSMSADEVELFKEQMRLVFKDPYLFLRAAPGFKSVGPYKRPDRSAIDSVETELAFETAPKTGLLHCHALLRFKHRTGIWINLSLLRQILSEFREEGKPAWYFNSKFVPEGGGEKLVRYLEKPEVGGKTFPVEMN